MLTRGMTGFDALVLAAGGAERYGAPKQLADWRGEPLVLAAIDLALAAPVDRVTVVLGAYAEAVETVLKTRACARLHWVIATDWREGLSASLRVGLDRLSEESRGALIFLGDMPLIPAQLPAHVTAALASGARAVQPRYRGAPAHPAGFSAKLYSELRCLNGDAGAGALLRRRRDVLHLNCDDAGAAFDIDTVGDLTAGAPAGERRCAARDYTLQQAGLA